MVDHTNGTSHELSKQPPPCAYVYRSWSRGVGPRYCPSIEDKIVRFADKERHQLFLEPEDAILGSLCSRTLIVILKDVSVSWFILSKGLENAEMIRTGYAIEYDIVSPHQLRATLETKKISGFHCSGQTNGTSDLRKKLLAKDYRGINAALKIQRQTELILKRSIGHD